MTIRVFVVEDHPVMRETLRDYLGLVPDIEVCGMAGSAEAALRDLPDAGAEVLLLDLALPGRSGLELLVDLGDFADAPASVVLSGHAERSHVARALEAGANGYVVKGDPAQIPVAIRRAAAGERYLAASLETGAAGTTTTTRDP
ncbi:response regulator [Salsipaludibacter albus]|uniref:response regulator n=1 Tax=Salsipaludibacter albus TaxID=2849650 RepID=UPI001EE3C4DF|nr:response regulator transcription factor [Salsipaludibacter albus]MBY5163261.1 response regulator transcription factor [Salsipaludibacter albus]